MILVTGAAGKTGLAVIKALSETGETVRAMVHNKTYRNAVSEAGAGQVVVGNLILSDDILEAVQGVRAIYHIPPNVHPGELEMGKLLINAARSAKVSHFVYHSVLHPQIESMPHHWQKLRVEEYLIESGVPYTILQPAIYMQNITSSLPEIKEKGIYLVPYSVKTILSLVDLKDLAEVAGIVLSNQYHHGAIYELVGNDAQTQQEIALALTEVLDREVQAQQMSLAYWERQAKTSGLDSYQINTLVKMFQHYEQFGFIGNLGVLSWLLGRQPTTLKNCLKVEIAELDI
ncbi:MAG: NmrA/HSCARG family protein [Anaerolineales bacterium]|nr:NmrA/HSCARG family protein [Anaerolineales bacterium]